MPDVPTRRRRPDRDGAVTSAGFGSSLPWRNRSRAC